MVSRSSGGSSKKGKVALAALAAALAKARVFLDGFLG